MSSKRNADYLERQAIRESNARSYPRRIPVALKEASGIKVTDVEGKEYFDCLAGAGTLALGHNHPVILEAIQQTLADKTPLHSLDLTTPIKDEFVEEIFDSLPDSFASKAKIQFCGPAGTDAVEAALKIVKTGTGNRSLFSFHGAYHGMTHGALSLTGNKSPKEALSGLMPDVHFLPYPYNYRCPFGEGGSKGVEIGKKYIEHVLDDPESGISTPAGMILELIQGEGGVIPAPDDWVQHLRKVTRKRNIPLIIDEIQTGLGRTGKLYAFEHAEIQPDVLILSKAIGGSLPMAVVVYDQSLDHWSPGAHAGTFRGNQLAMATGLATIRWIRQNKLEQHATKMGECFNEHFKKIQIHYPSLGEIRGRGLMIGIEIVNPSEHPDSLGSYPADPIKAKRIQQECFRRGLILELGGRYGSVIRFLPPLIITKEQIDQICAIFAEAVHVSNQPIPLNN